MWVRFAAKLASTSLARPNSAVPPPAMIVNRPSLAGSGPPETGASNQSTPASCFRRVAKARVRSGEMVEKSTSMSAPDVAWAIPCFPKQHSSTASPSSTQNMTMSEPLLTAAGLSAHTAPCGTTRSARSGSRFQTVMRYPWSSSLSTMGTPMIPNPTKPKLGFSDDKLMAKISLKPGSDRCAGHCPETCRPAPPRKSRA
jgi:hypothetical protein